MIATILYSSPTFEAVDYNERKVSKGDASLLCVENFGYLDTTKEYRSAHLQQYLIEYSKRNERIQKPQMHVAFSCKGQEMSNEELVAFGRKWLTEMGYNDPKQPLLIYSHNDTENNHIHVITSRVNPQGKKIEHDHERVRSKAFVEKTLGVDTKGELDKAVLKSFSYKFETFSQWRAVLEASGYDVKEDGGTLKIVRNGAYQQSLPTAEVEQRFSKDYADKKRLKQLKALLKKYRDDSCSMKELQEVMKRKFGVDLVFFGDKDTPKGYFVVDHSKQQVYKGSSIFKIRELLQFESPEDKMKRIDAFIDSKFEENPRLTGRDLHLLLRKHYSAAYREGKVLFGTQEFALKDYMQDALKYNFRVNKLNEFSFATNEEKEALCKFFKVKSGDVIADCKKEDAKTAFLLNIAREIVLSKLSYAESREAFSKHNLQLARMNDKHFVFDMQAKVVCCLEEYGISFRNGSVQYIPRTEEQGKKGTVSRHKKQKTAGSNARGSSANREYEVGNNRGDDFDDARKLKR